MVYVDNDPLVLAHACALLTCTSEGSTRYLHADMHDAETLATGAAEILDLAKPVGVFFTPSAPTGSTPSWRGSGPRGAARRCGRSMSPSAPNSSNW